MAVKHENICCPCAEKADLVRQGRSFQCSTLGCPHNLKDAWFGHLDTVPVLVSDIRCDTLCDPTDIQSKINRPDRSSFRKLQQFLLGTTSKITEENAEKFREILSDSPHECPSVLIIGNGTIGWGAQAISDDKTLDLTGTDIYASEHVDYVADAHYLPFKDKSFDGVWIQAVLEHVVEPQLVVAEIHRILRDDGIVYAETPFMQQVHEGAFDFTRFTVTGHRYLFKNFSAVNFGGLGGAGMSLAWSIRYFIWGLSRSRVLARVVGIFSTILLSFLERFADKRSKFDANSGSFFLGRKSRVSVRHADLVEMYKGMQ